MKAEFAQAKVIYYFNNILKRFLQLKPLHCDYTFLSIKHLLILKAYKK